MIPWKLVDTALVSGSQSVLRLYQREEDFSIRVDDVELMNSRVYESEEHFARLACARIQGCARPRVLLGGLGLGYTLKSALDALPPEAQVVVAELVPQVASWNRDLVGHLAGHPLHDPRVTLRVVDVACVLREAKAEYDLMLLDVDNGPAELTRERNAWIYTYAGLWTARSALRRGGMLGIWSAGPNAAFVRRLQLVGFEVEENDIRAAPGCYGVSHTIWLASALDARRTHSNWSPPSSPEAADGAVQAAPDSGRRGKPQA